jgi:hypothetical protein
MVRSEKVFTFPSGFFFGMVAPLYLEELPSFAPCGMVLLIQDLDRMLGLRRVVPLLVIQHPRVPLYTSLAVTHGRYRAPLPMMVAVPACMLRSHISQGWETVQSNEVLLFPSF